MTKKILRWFRQPALGALIACLAMLGPVHAEDIRYTAAVSTMMVADPVAAFQVVVFYPTQDPLRAWHAGPFDINASRDAAAVSGMRFPVILLSHGRQGGPMSHRMLATALAQAGFIVVLPTHVGDASGAPLAKSQAEILVNRPRQAKQALAAVLNDARFTSIADQDRIGMIGHSAGGYTALILAGAQPNFAHAAQYCASHHDPASCPTASAATTPAANVLTLANWQPDREPRLKALVLLDPLAVMFDRSSLQNIALPSLIYAPQDGSYLNQATNVDVVAAGLPQASFMPRVPGNHFVFIDPCPDAVAKLNALVCQDAPGVDRNAIHLKMTQEIIAFLQQHL